MDFQKDFPILNTKVNGRSLIYFDNAATSQKPKVVIDQINKYYETYNSNVHRGVHELSQKATNQYEAARAKVQQFIGANHLEEIIFTKGTTDGINIVASSWADNQLTIGDEIIISTMEHHSNIVPWQILCEKIGAVLVVAPINEKGELILEEFENLITPKTKLISISHVSNTLGTINPIEEIIQLAKKNNCKIVFPDLNEKEITKIINNNWQNLGHNLFELTFLKKILKDKNKIEIKGLDVLEKIRKDNLPVIFFSIHSSNWEICVPFLDHSNFKTGAIYRHINNTLFNRYVYKQRTDALRTNDSFLPE